MIGRDDIPYHPGTSAASLVDAPAATIRAGSRQAPYLRRLLRHAARRHRLCAQESAAPTRLTADAEYIGECSPVPSRESLGAGPRQNMIHVRQPRQ